MPYRDSVTRNMRDVDPPTGGCQRPVLRDGTNTESFTASDAAPLFSSGPLKKNK